MEADDAVEERAGDGRCRVGVAERDEVRVLGETIDDRQDHRFAGHLGQALDEVDGDIRPHLVRYFQRLQQSCRRLRLRLVALAGAAGAHPVLYEHTIARNVEVGAQAMKGFLDTLVLSGVREEEGLMAQVPLVREEDAAAV